MRTPVSFGSLSVAANPASANLTAVAPRPRGYGTPGLAVRLGMFHTGSSMGRSDGPIEGGCHSVELLAPLLPPISNPKLSPQRSRVDIVLAEQHRRARRQQSKPIERLGGTSCATRVRAASRHSRLTARGYTTVLLLVAGLVAGVAAVSQVADSTYQTTAASVRTTTVVMHEGETITSLAAQRAQGSDPARLADTIRALNGLADSDVPLPGDVLVVPSN
ncbi:MAG: LysM peptidoglycan-binding domain-containing protein [Antricoccus sp.]